MLKLCSCFKANKNDRKRHKQVNKDGLIDSDEKQYSSFELLLIGDDESGKIKVIEELVTSHDPFSLKEKILKTTAIERYIRDSLILLNNQHKGYTLKHDAKLTAKIRRNILRAFERNTPPVPLEYPESQQSVSYILNTANQTKFAYPLEFFQHAELIWIDAGLQNFLINSPKLHVSDCTRYFLDQVNRIRDPDYIPTIEDMIYSRFLSSDIFELSINLEEERVRLNLLEIDLSGEEQRNSVQSFCDNTKTIIFITDCSCFNVLTGNKGSQTRLHRSLELFKKIPHDKSRQTRPVIILLNKQDLLAKKIKSGIRLEEYFPDFVGYVPSDIKSHDVDFGENMEVTKAKYFIRDQFRKFDPYCYCQFTCDSDLTVRLILHDCTTISEQMTQ